MAPRLQSLPTELLLLIIEHVSISSNATPSLASLCLTAQRFRSLAEPYLYASYSNINHTDKPHLFPLCLINRPDLADHVRNIDLRVESEVNPMPEDAFRQLRRAIDELDLPESLADPWRWQLEKMGMLRAAVCAELCLLLASRKIKHVSLRLSVLNDFLAIGHILFETPNWSGRFDQVQSVSVAPPSDIRQLDLYNLAYLFKMPNLRRFEILGCEEHYLGRSEGWNSQGQLEANLGPWRLVQDSRVETIVIREGAIRHCAVNVLLNACQAVKYLHVEVDLLKSEWDLFQFFRLEDALCRHAESLEYLAIVQNQKNKERQGESGFRHSGCLSFLPRLDNLRSAVVPLRALTSIPDIGSIEVASSEDASPGELSNEAEIRQYLPPSPERISICNDNVHYGSTTHLFGLG